MELFEKGGLDTELRSLADERGIKAGVLIHPTRMALTAAAAGPSLFDLVEVMGRDATVRHLGHFIAFLRKGGEEVVHQD
jgi:glutamyl-tRNA synthetase